MYPTSPTVEAWRKAAADMARSNGVPVPSYYDGTMASIQRLNADGLTDINAAITWCQNAYVLNNRDQFPQANVDSATAFIAKNPSSSAWAGGFVQIENGLLAQLKDFGTAYVDELTKPASEALEDVRNAFGLSAVKQDPKGFATVAIAGIALGALAWWGWNKLKKGGV